MGIFGSKSSSGGSGGGSGKKSSKSKGGKVSQHDKAVLDLKTQRDKMRQYKKKIEAAMDKETEVAKEQLAAGNKKNALLCLRKKKYQATLLEKAEAQLENVQQMVDSIEFAQMEQQVFENLKEGNAVLKEIQSQMSLDEIDELMLDTEEAIDRQREIDEALSRAFLSRSPLLPPLSRLIGSPPLLLPSF
jgi:charged multivesicular body protein 6